jgi:hypothetical protein
LRLLQPKPSFETPQQACSHIWRCYTVFGHVVVPQRRDELAPLGPSTMGPRKRDCWLRIYVDKKVASQKRGNVYWLIVMDQYAQHRKPLFLVQGYFSEMRQVVDACQVASEQWRTDGSNSCKHKI